jgi:acetolactate synthase I/II/III large subunit
MKVSDYIASTLEQNGVTVVFEMIGGMITHIIDSLHQKTKINIVSLHHEQSAGFAAEAVGRLSDAPGVALATSGPGATNLVTAIASCFFDSTPTIFITGQVNISELSLNLPIRQQGFQETDIVSIAKPITKWATLVEDAEQIPSVFEKAFSLATSGRPGPVLIDIPMDIQRMDIEPEIRKSYLPSLNFEDKVEFYDQLSLNLSRSKRPLLLLGGGVRTSDSIELCRELVNELGVPVVYSLLGVDILPFGHPLRVGLIGTYGNRWANMALMQSDCLLVLGSRLDVRQTGADADSVSKERTIFHVDCDSGQLNNRVKATFTLVSQLKPAIKSIIESSSGEIQCTEWMQELNQLAVTYDDKSELAGCVGINPNEFIHSLSKASSPAKTFLADVGKHQMWTAQSIELTQDQRLLLSGGLGAMGFALPASIGSAFSTEQPVVCIVGDGGFQCNIQELEAIAHHQLPVKIVVLNNNSLGMVGQFQEDYFESRMHSTVWGYSAPDFKSVGEAYKIASKAISLPEEVDLALGWLWKQPSKPCVLDVRIDLDTKVYPKAAYGRKIDDMDPVLKNI